MSKYNQLLFAQSNHSAKNALTFELEIISYED